MSLDKRIAFIGAGSMTEALVAGMLKAEIAQITDLFATDIVAVRRDHMHERYGIRVTADNRQAVEWAEILVLSVEPQDLDDLLTVVKPSLSDECLVISVAAGYPIARIAGQLTPGRSIIRAMPNTPTSILAGVTALAAGQGISDFHRAVARAIFESVGTVVEVNEALMDAVTGLSGSGPAYIYVMIDALADGGVRMGLSRQVAELLAAQTVLGSARMLLESGEHPGRLKDKIASPGGTTIAGLEQLEERRFRARLMSAVEAATLRSQELGATSNKMVAPHHSIQ
jgi:pyrroline-5-carboxylate reductase